jgi:ribonucleoside-diphosphate reductase alpha chain
MREICESAWECADPGVQFDTTINAWHTCPESGRIRASNPCSEYMFIDNSACNLSSINLLHYVREDGSFDLEAFRHTVRVLILAQEILVDFSSYPDEEIARNSHLFRPLGLGYANLGSLLMVQGLPYDSDAGRALAAVLTAILTGAAYRVSAEIAATKQPFEEFPRNREAMLRVIGQHRDAVGRIASPEACPAELLAAAHTEWDAALAAGTKWGFRNAQVTVLAPTGTIGLLMDCDTTGVEPDYSLVKFKKLAGGGYFKIVNQSVRLALLRLGYTEGQTREILDYVLGTRSLAGTPQVTAAELRKRGLTSEELARVERALRGAFDFESAFAPHIVGEDALERLGVGAEDRARPDFSLLEALGFSRDAVAEAAHVACGAMTVEGAPHLAPEHYAVFDCANKCGPAGTRFIQPMGHVRMMAAVQPFLSGAISKTVNLGPATTVEQIEAIYRAAWELGLKAVALYRDGCKSSQPLTSGPRKPKDAAAAAPAAPQAQLDLFPELAEPHRRRLPQRRGGITVEARVAGHKVFLRTGEYENGDLGEVFIDMHKEGSSFRSLIMCFAIAVSKGLQYGVPLREFVDTFTFTNFEPRGVCDHPNIKMVTSVIDYVFRVLGMEYLGRTDFCQIKPETTEKVASAGRLVGRGTPPSPRRRAEPAAGAAGSGAAGSAESHAGNGGTRPDLAELKAVDEAKEAEEARQAEEAGEPEHAGRESIGATGGGDRAAVREAGGASAANAPAGRADARTASGRGTTDARLAAVAASPLDQQLAEFMSDSPFCDICGHITVRSGACYKCLNCGNSMGCS